MILSNFEVVKPRYENTQAEALQWIARAHAEAESKTRASEKDWDLEVFSRRMEKLLSRYGCGPSKIGKRGSELGDFLESDWSKVRILTMDMRERMAVFAEKVDRIFEALYPASSEPPRDLIHVTCTGYVAPSGAQKLVSARGWGGVTEVTHVYHMGCYASFPALRVAQGFLASPRRNEQDEVDIVHTELCSLHVNPSLHAPEQLVVQSLFADGSIRYTAGAEGVGLELLALREEVVPDSTEAMKWVCANWGMEMSLSKEVPDVLAKTLKGYLSKLLQDAGLAFSDVWRNGIFAIHPGGPRIIDNVQGVLELTDSQVETSRKILFEHGNMSSATLPHIWQRLVGDENVPSGTIIVSLAFGPGLTVSGGIFKKVG